MALWNHTKDEIWFFHVGGAFSFELEYTRWKEEHQRLINDLRSGVNSQLGDNELRVLVDAVMSHYDEIFRLKGIGTKVDVFHMLSGMWKTPAERFFMWLGGFRSSELLKVKLKGSKPFFTIIGFDHFFIIGNCVVRYWGTMWIR